MQKNESFKRILEHISQTPNRIELLASIEEKAENLLYYVVKDHPFIDEKKELMFIYLSVF